MYVLRAALLASLLLTSGCATIQQVLALRDVDFEVDRVSGVTVAGVALDGVRTAGDLSFTDIGRVGVAVSRGQLPLALDLHLLARNPADNSVSARLVRMDWTLLLEGRETISGTFAEETVLPPGQPVDVPIGIQLDLLEFFEGSAQDLVDVVLSLTGQGGEPKDVSLRATPTVDTALGPIRYPAPITIVSREVGQEP